MIAPNSPIDLTLIRTFPVPPDAVFAAWIDPSQLAQWWGTSEFPGSAAEIDLQVGGTWRACMTSPQGEDHWAGGTFQTIDPPRQLAFSFAWAAYPDSVSDITITFAPHVNGTEMTFHQRLSVSPETAAAYEAGWVATLDRLRTHFIAVPTA
jgi:uncharacterized protein YndB with AHSA1/START domain